MALRIGVAVGSLPLHAAITKTSPSVPKPKPRWELHWAVMAKARQV